MAIGPLIIWGLISVIVTSMVTLPYKSPEYVLVIAFFLVSGGPSAEDIGTFFNAKKTKENGGMGTKYADIEDFRIDWWIYPIWLLVIVVWAAFEISIFTYIA